MHTEKQFAVIESGSLQSWDDFRLDIPGLPVVPKRFLKKELASTSVELSLNSMPPGAEMPFIHRHRENEEIYIFLEGSGEFLADGTVIPINDGTCIRCNPTVERSWRNTGETPMRFLCLQGKAGSFLTGGTVRDGEIVAGKPQWESSAG